MLDDIPFTVGDRVRVKDNWRTVAPESPLIGRTSQVSAPGAYRKPGEVYYVPAKYVETVQEE